MRTWDERLCDAIDRIEARIEKHEGGCWFWPGATNGRGYGIIVIKTGVGREARSLYVHRLIYLRHRGDIPQDYEIDHLCRTRNCCNPDHLEAVTRAENRTRQAAAITECPKGHAYDEGNTSISGRKRHCRTCQADMKWLQRHPDAPLNDPRRRRRRAGS